MPLRTALWRALAALVLVAAYTGRSVSAHEVPNDVTIQAYVKAEGSTLRLLVRAPLIAMRDMTWPFREPGILDLTRADFELRNAATLWLGDEVKLFEGDRPLGDQRVVAVRATPSGDRSFESYAGALALVTGPREPDGANISTSEGFIDVLFEYPIASAASRFSIEPRWGRLGIQSLTIVRLVLPDGGIRPFELQSDPGLVRLDPEWYQAARRFTVLGFGHILDGLDHLLFLFCLVIPFRRFRELLVVVSAFTLGHSVTLIASAYNFAPTALWFPPLIEVLIAISILYMAIENIVGASLHRRWMVTVGFGLIHGFGFSFALRQTLQLAGSHLLTSLLAFNIGVELGQILVLAVFVPALVLLFRFAVPERIGTIVLSALVAHISWHWMTTRGGQLMQYTFVRPEMTPAFFADVLRMLMLLVAVAGVVWFLTVLGKGRQQKSEVRT